MRGLRGGGGDSGSTPPEMIFFFKKIGFLSNTGLDPLEIHKLQSQLSMKWRFAGEPMMACIK